MKKSKILVCDLMSPQGHVDINAFFIDILSKSFEIHSFFGEKIASRLGFQPSYSDKFVKYPYFFRFLFLIILHIRVIVKAKKCKVSKVLLFSYHAPSFIIASWLAKILRIKLYVFEHNTALTDKDDTLKLILKCQSRHVVRFCFMEKLVDKYIEMGWRAFLINHPIIKVDDSDKLPKLSLFRADFKLKCFCPSASSSLDSIVKAAKLNKDILFFLKGDAEQSKFHSLRKMKNIHIQPFYENYQLMMTKSDFVYIPVDFENRVSGPFFNALAARTLIVVDDSNFGSWAISEFPKYVSKDFNIMRNFQGMNDDAIISYNNLIENKLQEVLLK